MFTFDSFPSPDSSARLAPTALAHEFPTSAVPWPLTRSGEVSPSSPPSFRPRSPRFNHAIVLSHDMKERKTARSTLPRRERLDGRPDSSPPYQMGTVIETRWYHPSHYGADAGSSHVLGAGSGTLQVASFQSALQTYTLFVLHLSATRVSPVVSNCNALQPCAASPLHINTSAR